VVTVPLTVAVSPPMRAPSAGDATVSVGGLVSIVNCTDAVAVLPARSLALTTSMWEPSALTAAPLVNGAPSSVADSEARFASLAL
jgi:hypothetical protein